MPKAHAAPDEREAIGLGLATAALVQGEVNLARLIHFYVEVARREPGKIPAVLSAA